MSENVMLNVKAILKDGTERVIAKQLVCPPDTPKFNPPWVSERETYLFSHGWERENSINGGLPTYRDPKGSRLNGEMKHVKDLPNKGDDLNPVRPLHQLHLPPAFHSFMLEEAVEMQARRDQAGEEGLTPLERVEAVEARCNLAEDEVKRIRSAVKGILLAQHPTPLGVRLALREIFGWNSQESDDWKV